MTISPTDTPAVKTTSGRDAHGTDIDSLAYDFLTTCFEAERRYVAGGWFDPVGLHDAAYRHNLCGNHFADPVLGFIYSYIAACADYDLQPTIDHCLTVAEAQGDVPRDRLDHDWVFLLILDTDTTAGRVAKYAVEVARLNEVRVTEACHHLREFTKLCVDESRFRITVQPVGVVRMAYTSQRKKSNGRTRQRITV